MYYGRMVDTTLTLLHEWVNERESVWLGENRMDSILEVRKKHRERDREGGREKHRGGKNREGVGRERGSEVGVDSDGRSKSLVYTVPTWVLQQEEHLHESCRRVRLLSCRQSPPPLRVQEWRLCIYRDRWYRNSSYVIKQLGHISQPGRGKRAQSRKGIRLRDPAAGSVRDTGLPHWQCPDRELKKQTNDLTSRHAKCPNLWWQ